MTALKIDPNARPALVPIWSPPGRRDVIHLAMSLCDELIARFEKIRPSKASGIDIGPRIIDADLGTLRSQQTNDEADLKTVLQNLRSIRGDLEREFERTCEAECPPWYRPAYVEQRRSLQNEIMRVKMSSMRAIEQFIDDRDLRQAGVYAYQLCQIPLAKFKERIG